jgi:hypothetical protein
MTLTRLAWSEVQYHLDDDTVIHDAHGVPWRRNPAGSSWHNALVRADDGSGDIWSPDDQEMVYLDPPGVPEPPDGTRIEFEHHTDVYAAWRDDASSAQAGYTVGDGGEVWCLYGSSVPRSWPVMWLEFGESLRTAVRLVPHPDDVPNYREWGTAVMAREGAGFVR